MANHLPPSVQIAGNHITVYEGFFQVADVKKTGSIGALEAANFLKKSGLSDIILSRIWDLCDADGKGYLDKQGFFMSLKLIALVQNGQEATLGNLAMTVPPPKLGDVVPVLHNSTGDWRITATEKVKYDQIFDSLQPVNSKLPGDKVKPVLLNSNLPVDILSTIWDLSDIDKDGFLDKDEFAVAMHLVYHALDKDPVPNVLPLDLIPPGRRRKHPSGTLPGHQTTGVNLSAAAHALSATAAGSMLQQGNAQSTAGALVHSGGFGVPWVVSAAEKIKYDARFASIDTDCDGLINGLEVKDIFIQSGLPQGMLAHIWGLCDTHSVGSLNSEQFALAMHLIEQKMTRGTDPPPALTTDMLPPSMRSDVAVSSEFSKEIESIEKEIEDLKREKIALEADKQQKEADVRIRNGEVQTLQKELDAIASTNQQLERQKAEAQKRLDELDDKKARCQEIVRDLKERTEEKQRGVNELKERFTQQERSIKNQEEETVRLRYELMRLADEQHQLEQQLEVSRQQSEQRRRQQQADLLPQISSAKEQIQKLQKEQTDCNELLSQYTALINGDPGAEEPAADAAVLAAAATTAAAGSLDWVTPAAAKSSVSLDFGGWTPAPAASQKTGAASSADPFGSSAPFVASFKEDPFQSDPFKTSGTVDPFPEDPFKADTFSKDPFHGDDPFKNDPFVKGASTDPFVSVTASSSSKGMDPFASDAFASAGLVGGKAASPLPSLASASKKAPPPRPALPSQQQKKPEQPNAFGFGAVAGDPFGGADPFGNSHSASTDPFGGTSSSSTGKASGKDPFAAHFADFTWDASSSVWPSSADANQRAEQQQSVASPAGNPISPGRIETDI